MATIPSKAKYNPARKLMPGAPLPSLQTRAVESRLFELSRGQEFTPHLHFYLSDTPSVPGGARGVHLDKISSSDDTPHAFIYSIAETPLWDHGVNPDSLGFYAANLSTGNNFLTCTPTDLVTLGNTNSAGGAVLGASGGKVAMYGGSPALQPSGSSDVLASLVTVGLRAASSNPPLNLGTGSITAGVSTFTAPATGRCLTLNSDLGATVFVQPPSGTNFSNYKVNGVLQMATDRGATGSFQFTIQNLHSGNIWLTNDGSDNITLGIATANMGFFGATPVAQIAGSSDVLAGMVSLGFRAASNNPPLNLGTGAITCGAVTSGAIAATTASFSASQALQGAGGNGLSFKESVPSPPTNADYTLTSSEASALIVVLVAGSWLAGHNIILPNTIGGVWMVNNLTGFSATFKTAAGTGIAVANGKTALLWGNGTNIFRMTPDT